MQEIVFKRLRPEARLPVRATEQSAGYDLCACVGEAVVIRAGGRALIPTGVAMELRTARPAAAFVFGRSGLGIRHGIAPSNAVGVIDADYRGEIMVGLSNHADADYVVQPGERVAQLVVMPVLTPPVREADTLSDTARGAGGLGSTGRD